MRIVVDLQGAQSASRFRGIGRYSLALAQALARNAAARGHELWLVMNGALGGPEQLAELMNAFSTLVPRSRMQVFDPPLPVAQMTAGNEARALSAELLREFFIGQLAPDAVLVTSLFEGYVDDTVVSIGRFMPGARTAVIQYDLIPLLHPERYLVTPQQQRYYAGRIDSLKRAGLLLGISDYARDEAITHLGVDAARVVAISTAVDARFQPGPPARPARLATLGIEREFVMYTPGGMDARKNVEGLIEAFSLLPATLQQSHQLVLASTISSEEHSRLERCAARHRLPAKTLVLTGYVEDALLIDLYRSTALFVFPSLHEGFGLPALEAMACGAPVIGANNSSIPEVIGLDEALFDGTDPAAVAAAMARVLGDPAAAGRLRAHAAAQSGRFSWDRTAQRCLLALEQSFAVPAAAPPAPARRRLAFVSPLPPERSGIADYAAQLLPALLDWFDIELILQQPTVQLAPELMALPRRSVDWFMAHADHFDQILYQFGNSPFHGHMFKMLEAWPGVVVLHDFFLSRVLAYEQMIGAMPGAWTDALFHSHGYPALLAGDSRSDTEAAHDNYPCNLAVLQNASAVIVHSAHSEALGRQWYGPAATQNWHIVPLPRAAPPAIGRSAARRALGLDEDAFIVCSFGFIAPTKLTHLLIDAWRRSALDGDPQCQLVLVGANHDGEYGRQIVVAAGGRVRIAGWTDEAKYQLYLAAADGAVQLRCNSRGETSAAVLDCLNAGLATIVNANGSMAELPREAVCILDDKLDVVQLAAALEHLHHDASWRATTGAAARALMEQQHRPARTAAHYARILDQGWQRSRTDRFALIEALAQQADVTESDLQQIAAALARLPDALAPRQLLVDVSNIANNDLRTGIERVVRAQVLALLRQPGHAVRVEPVRLSCEDGHWQYRYAHAWTQALLGIAADGVPDHVVDIQPGDIFFCADYAPVEVSAAARSGLYAHWRARGVALHFQVFDLLPVLQPHHFPYGADLLHATWLASVAGVADQLICISASVAQEMAAWLAEQPATANATPRIVSLHLGADFDGANSAGAVPSAPSGATRHAGHFLIVATLEPRKGYLQTLEAFERLWESGVEVTLTIVGSEGWKPLTSRERRTIPHIVSRIKQLQQRYGKRLVWLQGIDDQQLEQLYRASACLLAPSQGEGFGLPLIEAARQGLPILARDLPVFREVGGDRISYFHGTDAAALAEAISRWLANQVHRDSAAASLSWMSWQQHAAGLMELLTRTRTSDSR